MLSAGTDRAAAIAAFDASLKAKPDWVLSGYASWGAARAASLAAKHQEVIARAATIPTDHAIAAEARLLAADSYAELGNAMRAMEIWREHLASKPRPIRWAEVALRLAGHLLEGSPTDEQAKEALRLARRVQVEAPGFQASRAKETETVALSELPTELRRSLSQLTPDERLQRAKGLLDAGRRDEMQREIKEILDALGPTEQTSRTSCEASILKAESLGRDKATRSQSADAYGDASRRCENLKGKLPDVLFQGGKMSAKVGRYDEALGRYSRLEGEFGESNLADDARLRAAKTALLQGDENKFVEMLAKMPDNYPNGDMLDEGLFELALHHMSQGNWAAAITPLERSVEMRPRERTYWEAGRALYYLGRAQQAMGRLPQAQESWKRVVENYPFSYYTVQAYSRLAEQDAQAARTAFALAESKEATGPYISALPPSLARPGFDRAMELLRLGEGAFAQKEIAALGLSEDDDAGNWTVAILYAKAGMIDSAFKYARTHTKDWSEHFPSGKWRELWDLAYPRPYLSAMEREAQRSGIPVALGYGITREESAFDPAVVSSADAYGLMQLILPTAKRVGKSLDIKVDVAALKQPETNIALGCKLLADLRAMFPNAPFLAIPSYNAGAGATKKWLTSRPTDDWDIWVDLITYEETRKYTKRVMASVAAYSYLIDRTKIDDAMRSPIRPRP